jgi:guanyl-specific ribonuclease Sa
MMQRNGKWAMVLLALIASAWFVALPGPAARSAFPVEVGQTLRLIAAGGPFPYQRDGVVFGNYEHRLPEQTRGYYHEYTVPTPGAHNRGARRVIAGGKPPREFWYTGDHYETFQRIEGSP